MTEQDQKTLYTAFVMLGLLMKGSTPSAVPSTAKWIVEEVMKDETA